MRERLKIDEIGFRENERLIAYDLGNAVLASNLRLQQHFGLRAESLQVFLLIVLATVQKLLRRVDQTPDLLDNSPVPAEYRGGISRRQIAEVLGIPFETVRRHVDQLAKKGLVEERRRGSLSTCGGTLRSLSEAGIPLALGQQSVQLVNMLMKKQVVGFPSDLKRGQRGSG